MFKYIFSIFIVDVWLRNMYNMFEVINIKYQSVELFLGGVAVWPPSSDSDHKDYSWLLHV